MVGRKHRSERGQVLAIFALALVAIIAMTGLVLDGGSTFVQRRDQQNVADSAAMAAAYEYYNNFSESGAQSAAQTNSTVNGYTNGSDGTTVSVAVENGSAGSKEITVSVTKPHANHFAGIVGMSSWNVSTTATVRVGAPNAALGAAPIIFNREAFGFPDANVPNTVEQEYGEPEPGNEDVPQNSTQFNWTIYCTANGNPCNANTNGVRDLIAGTNQKGNVITVDDNIAPLNAGSHTALFSDLAGLVGQTFPVAIVNDDGTFAGWAMFHLTGSVGGSTKKIRGYFLTKYQGDSLTISAGAAPGTSEFGGHVLELIN